MLGAEKTTLKNNLSLEWKQNLKSSVIDLTNRQRLTLCLHCPLSHSPKGVWIWCLDHFERCIDCSPILILHQGSKLWCISWKLFLTFLYIFYKVCIRREQGYCKIGWTQSTDRDSFKISRPATNFKSAVGNPGCDPDSVTIPGRQSLCFFVPWSNDSSLTLMCNFAPSVLSLRAV